LITPQDAVTSLGYKNLTAKLKTCGLPVFLAIAEGVRGASFYLKNGEHLRLGSS
jgi:hypothetical protein